MGLRPVRQLKRMCIETIVKNFQSAPQLYCIYVVDDPVSQPRDSKPLAVYEDINILPDDDVEAITASLQTNVRYTLNLNHTGTRASIFCISFWFIISRFTECA